MYSEIISMINLIYLSIYFLNRGRCNINPAGNTDTCSFLAVTRYVLDAMTRNKYQRATKHVRPLSCIYALIVKQLLTYSCFHRFRKFFKVNDFASFSYSYSVSLVPDLLLGCKILSNPKITFFCSWVISKCLFSR